MEKKKKIPIKKMINNFSQPLEIDLEPNHHVGGRVRDKKFISLENDEHLRTLNLIMILFHKISVGTITEYFRS